MSKVIRACNCDYSQCKMSDHRKHVHIGDECFHPYNIHHNTRTIFGKNSKTTNDIDFKRRYQNWGI
ncbi:MAG: hypothetical protein NPMRD1_70006 [Nitrosopumilales archaeon]|nr:MAG: hypothetical protein NPMRD1_70006 [Nitrosopumilales archaeon]